MRCVAFDVGLKRTGVAVSDASGTLARPYRVLHGRDVLEAALAVVREFDADGLELVVVGLPRRLDGSDTHATAAARAFGKALAARTEVPVVFEDERLTSVDAEARLAELEPDWRARKRKIDAAAAAVLLQDVLDRRAAGRREQVGDGESD
jgi:putative Holliday junction resolvase